MTKSKFLYGVWSEGRRKTVRVLSLFSIIFSIVGFFFCFVAILITKLLHIVAIAGMGILLGGLGLLFTYLAQAREFRIYENGISYPKSFGRLFILYPYILEIKLNTQQEKFIPEIEIHLKDGTTLKFPKTQIYDWKEFYRVMLEELKGKVKVVE